MTYRKEAILRDGASVVIRELLPADRAGLVALFARMSPLSLRHRFFAVKQGVTERELDVLSKPDGVNHIALAAEIGTTIVGVGRYVVASADTAEVAFDVGDADQGRGIGTLLLDHLARIARSRGITTFRAEVEADNSQMLEVFERSGFRVSEKLSAGIYDVEFAIADTDRFLRAAAERERRAAARSIRPFFAPGSVAVIGASRTPQTIGRAILDNLIRDGFRGPIYPINPAANEIAGRRAYRSVLDVGKPIDLAIVAVPAPAVEQVVRDCAAAHVRAVVVITAGFGESSAAGRDTETRLRELARASGMRLIGPNCMGVLSTNPGVNLDATFSPVFPPRGNISMASQSGALGLAMIDYARGLELGLADFASIGNKIDVSVNDLLSYWHDDPNTRVIALYLESFGNPRSFARLVPDVARERPIVAVKSGRSAAGTRAASSHSASLASLDVGIDALFAQTGVIRTDTLEQMFDVLSLLSSQPVPRGKRVGVVTNAGGPGILLADACEAHGLVLPALSPPTLDQLRALLPAAAGFGNPIDMTAAAPPEHFEAALSLVGNDPEIDAVVAIYVPPLVTAPDDVAAAIARGAGSVPSHKPIATVFMSSKGTPSLLSRGPRGALPSYSFPESAALALAAATRYAQWRKRPILPKLALPEAQHQAVRERIAASRIGPDGWLSYDDTCALLEAAGIPLVPHRTVDADPDAAVAAARELGFPVVLKAIVPKLVHKTEAGAVVLDLGADDAVRAAAADLARRLDVRGFIVQRQVRRGVEALAGVTTDVSLGQLLVAGIGGTAVELYKDAAFRVTPVTDVDLDEMLGELRGRVLFDGFRGAPPADRPALLAVLRKLAGLVESAPELVELDLNPVVVLLPWQGAVAVDARLRLKR